MTFQHSNPAETYKYRAVPAQLEFHERHKAAMRRMHESARLRSLPKPAPAPVAEPVVVPMEDQFAKAHAMLRGTQVQKIKAIQRAAAAKYDVTVSDIVSDQRTKDIVRPRQVAMYLAKELTTKSFPEIGRQFGGRDHTTVLHAIRKIGGRRVVDAVLNAEIEELTAELVGEAGGTNA